MIPVTMLSSYLFCPRKLYLEKVLNISLPPTEAMIKGTIRHKIYDSINKYEEILINSINEKEGYDDIYNKYKKTYFKILKKTIIVNKRQLYSFGMKLKDTFTEFWPYVLEESKIRSEKIYDFKKKTNLSNKDLWNSFTPKISSEYWISSNAFRLKGVIDQIEIYKEGKHIPFELKTGKMPREGVWEGHRLQMGAYIMLLNEKLNRNIDFGYIRYIDWKETRKVHINPFFRDEVIEVRDKVEKLLNSNDLPQIVSEKKKCVSCELKKKCYSINKE